MSGCNGPPITSKTQQKHATIYTLTNGMSLRSWKRFKSGEAKQTPSLHSMNAVIYARYSSYGQNEQSIEGQLRECLPSLTGGLRHSGRQTAPRSARIR